MNTSGSPKTRQSTMRSSQPPSACPCPVVLVLPGGWHRSAASWRRAGDVATRVALIASRPCLG